jgi:hypothetical protein
LESFVVVVCAPRSCIFRSMHGFWKRGQLLFFLDVPSFEDLINWTMTLVVSKSDESLPCTKLIGHHRGCWDEDDHTNNHD